jgi:DNA-binding response OmpR family regulator
MVVDDEPALASLVASYLVKEGFEVRQAASGPEALATAREIRPDVMILDLNLPGLDGVEVARQLRLFSDAYLIMLTARAEEVDKLIGLAVGADDYMTKPFSPRELVARVRALMRRPRSPGIVSSGPLPGSSRVPSRRVSASGSFAPTARAQSEPVAQQVPGAPLATPGVSVGPGTAPGTGAPLSGGAPFGTGNQRRLVVGDLVIDTAGREVILAGNEVQLTRTEFDLLATLAAQVGRVLTREELLRTVWGPTWVGDPHAADVHLANVRRKLGDSAAAGRYVRTVRGVGYRLGTGQ